MDTHPRSAKDAEDTEGAIAGGDLATIVRTIDPILLRMIDGVQKGSLGAVELIDIAVRIRTILQEAVRHGDDGSVGQQDVGQRGAVLRDGPDARPAQNRR